MNEVIQKSAKEIRLDAAREVFCAEYIKDLSVPNAAERAGIKYAEGITLFKQERTQKIIQSYMDERSKNTAIDAEYVLNGIVDTIERCKQAVPVINRRGDQVYTTTADGEVAAAYRFEPHAALKGYELLGKHLKLFVERHEITGENGTPIQHLIAAAKISPEDAAALYQKAIKNTSDTIDG